MCGVLDLQTDRGGEGKRCSTMAPHIMVVAFPAQGHVNPILQLAKLLANRGVLTTFVTTAHAHHLISGNAATTTVAGLSFASISDGYDSSSDVETTTHDYAENFKRHGPSSLTSLVRSLASSGQPVDCIAYNFLLPWAADVASNLGIPSALLWIQPASVLSIYYHFVQESRHLFGDTSAVIHLPGLPSLHKHDLPTFLLPEDVLFDSVCHNLSSLFKATRNSKTKWVLVNSFDALEPEAISHIRSIFSGVAAVGPMIPSAFIDGNDPNDTSFGGDLLNRKHPKNGCTTPEGSVLEWLDSKPESTIVYISFGTWAKLAAAQLDEVAMWLTESEYGFLWVVRPPEKYGGFSSGFEEALKQRGMVAEWCSQVEVLNHPAVSCFVTHSGWNSTLEGLVSGKPMVCLPQWSEQPTNAKFVQDVWRTGVRAQRGEGGVVGREELRRCVGEVMGEQRGKELRENAAKYKEVAKKAVEDGGSSDRSIRAFIDDHGKKNLVSSGPSEGNILVCDSRSTVAEAGCS